MVVLPGARLLKTVSGKRALIVGAASGIGRAIAVALARRGTRLLLFDIDGEALEQAGADLSRRGAAVSLYRGDATRPEEVEAAVRKLVDTWQGVDILVNSAGNLYWGPTHMMTPRQLEEVVAVNLDATILFTRALLPVLRAQPEAHIVNVASTAGLAGAYHRSVYSACKYGMVGFSESLRIEYRRTRLGVSVVCPGYVAGTRLFERVLRAPGAGAPVPADWEEGFAPAEAVAEAAVAAMLGRGGIVLPSASDRAVNLLRRASPAFLQWIYGYLCRSRLKAFADPAFVRVEGGFEGHSR
jgi:NAD(P)-dependent dehydrogenase (short-subunit alcohol dehydrogenase family)